MRIRRVGLVIGLVFWWISCQLPGMVPGIETAREEAVRESLVGRWEAMVGRRAFVLELQGDGTYALGTESGSWQVAGVQFQLTTGAEDEAVERLYRYELQDTTLTLHEGDLAQSLSFTRIPGDRGFVAAYASWVSKLSWGEAEERLFRILSILGIVILSVVLLALIRLVSTFVVFNERGPLKFLYVRNRSRARTIHSVVLNLLKYVIYFTALGQILNEVGVNYTTYIASVSVIGLAVGFGSQGLVQDIVTGFFLLFDGQFSVGDMVEISGQTGVVEEMGLRTTRIRNYLGQAMVVPNRNIAVVGNYTKGCVEAFVDVAVLGDRPTSGLRRQLTEVASELYRQFQGTILQEPDNLGTLRLKTGEAFIRLRFKLWPQQQAFFEGQVVGRIQEYLKREEIENPHARITVFYRHPEPRPSPAWRFLRRGRRAGLKGEGPAERPQPEGGEPPARG